MGEITVEVIWAALVGFTLAVVRTAVRFAMSPEGRVVLRVLRESGARAAMKAHGALLREVERARAQDSAGGAEITADERRVIAKAAVDALIHEIDVLGVLEQVAKAFGGVEKLEADLVRRIEEKMKAK